MEDPTDKAFTAGLTIGFAVGLAVCGLLGILFGSHVGETRIRAEAVALGYARYISENGGPAFQWCPTPTPMPAEQAARAAGRASE